MPKLSCIVDIKKSKIVGKIKKRDLQKLIYIFQYQQEPAPPINLVFPLRSGGAGFYSGLVPHVTDQLRNMGYSVKIYDRRPRVILPEEYVEKKMRFIESRLKKKIGSHLRQYQKAAISLGLRFPHGTFEMATGSGKGVVFGSLIKIFSKKTMILVDSVELMHQIADEISLLIPKKLIGRYGAGIKELNKYTVGIVDSLIRRPSIMKSIEYIVTDEAHLAAASQFRSLILKSSAYIRHGFTGTYTRSMDTELNLLYSVTGQKLCSVTCSDLVEQRYLSRPYITMVQLPRPKNAPPGGLPREIAIRKYIVYNKRRNRLACEYARFHYLQGHKVMIFVTRVQHGKLIEEMLITHLDIDRFDVCFSHGQSGIQNRKDSLSNFESGQAPILIATKIFEKGINVPSVDVGINLKGEKTEIGCRQTLGRILRGSGVCFYLDFMESATRQLKGYSTHRLGIYNSEPAFVVRSVPPQEMCDVRFHKEATNYGPTLFPPGHALSSVHTE